MKTFKLKRLQIIKNVDDEMVKHPIELIDGLIINREDDKGRWTIEAFLEKSYLDYFHQLEQKQDEVMVEVRITKETNEPATFITSITAINEIDDYMNVLLMGTIVDQRKSKIEALLTELIAKGYQGEELLEKFKENIDYKSV